MTAMEMLWADLGSPNDATSTRAMLRLAAVPKEAVPFLAGRLRAAGSKVDEKRIDGRDAEFASDQERS